MNKPYAVFHGGLWCIFRCKPQRNEFGKIYWPLPTVMRQTLLNALEDHYKYIGWDGYVDKERVHRHD